MQCPNCRNENQAAAQRCAFCGALLTASGGTSNPFGDQNPYAATPVPHWPPPNPTDNAVLRWLIPIGRSPWAIVSGYCGLISIGCCPLGPIAIFTGIMAVKQLKRDKNLSGMGRAIFGIVTGVLTTIGLAVSLFVIAANGMK